MVLSFTNGLTLNDWSWLSKAHAFTSKYCCVATDSIKLKPFSRTSSYFPFILKTVRDLPRPLSGYNRNRTLQEQWSLLSLKLFPIKAQQGVPWVSCNTATRLRSMTKFAVYSGSVGRYCFEFEWFVLSLMLTVLFASLALKTFSAPSNKTL